ncbi:trihelix transcription factor GT-3b [Chanos chanos]|uniref:Trihelix transcription factor GT-3b n=1 Tax=Chanos chanos TaxID=29144 RepID=A0A6J2UXI3_CHACN|nr:trihelix transcription factor GT-3b-like [Chanos chanos]
MAHVRKFAGIPMSKSMRGICKEEDYVFLGTLDEKESSQEETTFLESEWKAKREERHLRRLEREEQERKRLLELEEQRKEKEQKWRDHVAQLANKRMGLRERAQRLQEFRDFQRKVLAEDLGLDPSSASEKITQLLQRL